MPGDNGSGTYVRFHDWTDDKAAVVPVTGSRMDTEMDGIATALTNRICRDGQSTTTARIPFASGISTAAGGALITGNSTITGTFGVSSIVTVTASATSSSAITGALIVGGGIGAREINAVAISASGLISGMGATPVGGVMDYAGTTAPTGWLLCFGQSLVRADYPALFTAIGTTHGAADGTHFNLPDCRGRVSAGDDDMGGTSANRLTTPINGDTLGAVGGGETVSITVQQTNLPNVNFTGTTSTEAPDLGINGTTSALATPGNNTLQGNNSAANEFNIITEDHDHTVSVSSGGSGTALTPSIVQPTIILNKIIFAGVA